MVQTHEQKEQRSIGLKEKVMSGHVIVIHPHRKYTAQWYVTFMHQSAETVQHSIQHENRTELRRQACYIWHKHRKTFSFFPPKTSKIKSQASYRLFPSTLLHKGDTTSCSAACAISTFKACFDISTKLNHLLYSWCLMIVEISLPMMVYVRWIFDNMGAINRYDCV